MGLAGRIFLTSIPILINLYAARYREQDMRKVFVNEPKDFGLPVEQIFDFIIVGGGTAGCVLARRLSDEKFSVLLLEAGGNAPPLQKVPFVSTITKDLSSINFLYESVPQQNAGLLDNGILKTPAGKMMGGSSSHNDHLYERGHPLDYKLWADLTGDDSWLYKNILKYFKKSENYMGKFKLKGQYGKGGPMTITRPNYAPGRSIWLKAGKQSGYKVIDSNGPQKEGFFPNEFTKKFGRRVSIYSAYIKPIERKQKKLTIKRYSTVSKILFDDNKVAQQVYYRQHGLPKIAKARKEIILSAGVFGTPILLMKSGIGPEDQLKLTKAEPISILPGVGENMIDHPYLEVAPFFVKDASTAWEINQNLTFESFRQFVKKGDGPLTNSYRVGNAAAFIASKRARANTKAKSGTWPDLQFYYTFMGPQVNALSCYVGLNRPLSTGRLTFNGSATWKDTNYLPVLDYKYFSVESDFTVMIEGINFCLKTIETTKAFQGIGAKFTTQPIDQCKRFTFRSNDYWKCYIRYLVTPSFHVVGTCKMGTVNDPMAVVDSKLNVIGVKQLRVVDASIFPTITNANTASPTIMVAEKAANDMVQMYRTGNGRKNQGRSKK